MRFEPMLAPSKTPDTSKLKYPMLASYKLDGIRATVQNGVLLSRNMKPIANKNVQERFKNLPNGLDGELIVGDPFGEGVFQRTSSVVMSHDKPADDVTFHVFDRYFEAANVGFAARLGSVHGQGNLNSKHAISVEHWEVLDEDELKIVENNALEAGYEGLMLRSPDGPYREGRSTAREGYLFKIKRFKDSEAEILDTFEEMENTNEAGVDELGHTERSSSKSGMVGKGTLGGFQVRDLKTRVAFRIGGGLTAEQRADLWAIRAELPGQIVKYKYFPVGVKDKPRFPVFLGFRDKADM